MKFDSVFSQLKVLIQPLGCLVLCFVLLLSLSLLLVFEDAVIDHTLDHHGRRLTRRIINLQVVLYVLALVIPYQRVEPIFGTYFYRV